MISDGLVLCFKDVPIKTISIINLGANLIEFIFLMWGLGGNLLIQSGFALYIVGMIFEILSYSTLIAIHIIIVNREQRNYGILNQIGKIICFIALLPRSLGLLFIFIASIIFMAKYSSAESQDSLFTNSISGKEWCAAVVPFIFIILITLFTIYCLNALYYMFDKNNFDSNVGIANSSPQNIRNVNVLEKPNTPYNYEMNPMKNNDNNNIDSRNNLYNNPPSIPVNNQNAA